MSSSDVFSVLDARYMPLFDKLSTSGKLKVIKEIKSSNYYSRIEPIEAGEEINISDPITDDLNTNFYLHRLAEISQILNSGKKCPRTFIIGKNYANLPKVEIYPMDFDQILFLHTDKNLLIVLEILQDCVPWEFSPTNPTTIINGNVSLYTGKKDHVEESEIKKILTSALNNTFNKAGPKREYDVNINKMTPKPVITFDPVDELGSVRYLLLWQSLICCTQRSHEGISIGSKEELGHIRKKVNAMILIKGLMILYANASEESVSENKKYFSKPFLLTPERLTTSYNAVIDLLTNRTQSLLDRSVLHQQNQLPVISIQTPLVDKKSLANISYHTFDNNDTPARATLSDSESDIDFIGSDMDDELKLHLYSSSSFLNSHAVFSE